MLNWVLLRSPVISCDLLRSPAHSLALAPKLSPRTHGHPPTAVPARCSQGMLKAFNRWDEVVAERLRMQQFGRRMLNSGLNKAWNAWIEAADAHRRLVALASRFVNKASLQAFNRWGILTASSTKRPIPRVLLFPFSAEMYTPPSPARVAVEAAESSAHARASMTRAGGRMLNVPLTRAWM